MIAWDAVLLAALLMLLYSLGIAGLLYRLLPSPPDTRGPDALSVGLALSPYAAGMVTIALLVVLGPQPDATYVWLQFGVAGGLALLSLRHISDIAQWVSGPLRGALARPLSLLCFAVRIEPVLAIILLALLGELAFQALVVPLVENDALEYADIGKVLYERRTPDAYPLVEADPRTGTYLPWTHPPLYVALIFLAYLLQGTPETPGLMRLIAPYCIIATLVLLTRIAVATQCERRWQLALLACTLVLATPLLSRMAGGASIDALPILGMTMVFAVISLYSDAPLKYRIALVGTVLGLSLWSHSQAIVFPLLALAGIVSMRWFQRRPMFAECAGVLLIGAVIGGLPFLRNWMIIGSPISDKPAVFALEALDWNSYITVGRALTSTYNRIVLGVLRGWTDYSEYWLTFWFMTVGVALLAPKLMRRRDVAAPYAIVVLLSAAAIIAAYHAGMLLSVLIGSNQMVRNGRYLLPMLPFAGLLAAYFLVRLTALEGGWGKTGIGRSGSAIWIALEIDLRRPGRLIALAAVLGLLAMIGNLIKDRLQSERSQFGSLKTALRATERARLLTYPFYRVLSYMREALPENSVVLSFRPADMYYAKHKMISDLDPRLIPAYLEADPARMAAALAQLGVTHVYRPNYSIPPIYNTAMMRLLADTRLSRLLHSDENYAVFSLVSARAAPDRRQAEAQPSQTWELAPDRFPWTGSAGPIAPVFARLCSTADFRVGSSDPQPTVRACPFVPSQRAIYISGVGDQSKFNDDPDTFVRITPRDGAYRYTASVSGRGYIRILIYEKTPTTLSQRLVDDAVLTQARKDMTRVFQVAPDVTHVRVAIWVDGDGEMRIHDFNLEALPDDSTRVTR